MGANPLIGVLYHWIGGLASASNFIPFRPIKRWSWEIYWIVQGFAAWIVAPAVLGYLFVPGLSSILHQASSATMWHSFLWGALWGVGGLTFGLAIRYLGIALGYAIALGFCTAFGTLMPPIFSGQMSTIVHQRGGQVILLGVFICLLAIAVNGLAGYSKEKEVSAEEKALLGERDYSFAKGLAVAIFAGIMSACFAYGLAAGKPIANITRDQLAAEHRALLWQNLPVLVVVLWGGFVTNLIWSAILILMVCEGFGVPGQSHGYLNHGSCEYAGGAGLMLLVFAALAFRLYAQSKTPNEARPEQWNVEKRPGFLEGGGRRVEEGQARRRPCAPQRARSRARPERSASRISGPAKAGRARVSASSHRR